MYDFLDKYYILRVFIITTITFLFMVLVINITRLAGADYPVLFAFGAIFLINYNLSYFFASAREPKDNKRL